MSELHVTRSSRASSRALSLARAILASIVLFTVSRTLHAQQPVSLKSDVETVTSTIRALFAAGERGDLTALDTLYAGDSVTMVEGAGINRGWADYRDNHLGPELKQMKNFIYRPSEIEAHTAGNVAWAIFRYAIKADLSGRAIDNVGRGTAILERRGRKWVVRHIQTGSRARRPTDPPLAP